VISHSHTAEEGRVPVPLSSSRRYLVIVRAGRQSLHSTWWDQAQAPEFDLLVAAYEPGGQRDGDDMIYVPGSKVSGYNELFQRRPDLIDRYEYIALFDDDIVTTVGDLNRLFRIGETYQLSLFQPGLSARSFFSYAATLANPRFLLRFTNTVEMMCPVFRAGYLKEVLPLFGLGFETGIDLVWTRLGNTPWFRYAIIDDVAVTHTRPVGTTKGENGFRDDETYDGQVAALLSRFHVEFRGFVSYGAIDKAGSLILSRIRIAIDSLRLWAAWHLSPMAKLCFARFLICHTWHALARPLNLSPVTLARPNYSGSAPLRV
jgi:hypothetical protein